MPVVAIKTLKLVVASNNPEPVIMTQAVSNASFPKQTKPRYIFPNVLPPIVVEATITVATTIIAEASLLFLGLGQQPPSPS